MPYNKETGEHYPYTDEGVEQYEKDTGKGMPMKNTAYWKAKSGVASPAKDTNPHTGLKPPHTEENHRRRKKSRPEKGSDAYEKTKEKAWKNSDSYKSDKEYYDKKEKRESTAGYTPE
tara:strand:- start:129 stop:479 length:351 start_codon:yes stop_codon:yes gene_type:complete